MRARCPCARLLLTRCGSGRRPKQTPRGGGGDVGEVDWQVLYTESDGRVLIDLIAFDINDGADPSSKGQLLCKLLHVPKAFNAQVLKAAASAHGLNTLDHCRQLLCSAFQKLLEREALLQHINLKQGIGASDPPTPLLFGALPLQSRSAIHRCPHIRRHSEFRPLVGGCGGEAEGATAEHVLDREQQVMQICACQWLCLLLF